MELAAAHSSGNSKKPRILVVDDEQDIMLVIKKGLADRGFEVEGYTTPEEALVHFIPHSFELLLTDIRMPKMSGFELYRKIRKNDEKIKVAFMTAFDIYENEFSLMFPKIDVDMFIKKPISIIKLGEELEKAFVKVEPLVKSDV